MAKAGERAKIEVGFRVGNLTVKAPTEQRKSGYMVWVCRCDCGGSILLDTRCLQRGTVRDCGCITPTTPGQKDLRGMKFGQLTPLYPTQKRIRGNSVWICQCDCGNTCEAVSTQMTSGYTKSCGCLGHPPLKDMILTKSVSRFARNTVDCLYYTRTLKALGIAVVFEKENINSLEEDSELRITLSGAFAQSESESISANVTWGKRRAMEAGKASIQYKKLYGYRKGEDGKPEIIPEQAEIIRRIYDHYLGGASLRMLKEELEAEQIPCFEDSPEWSITRIRSILQNEKYCGDVLMQKTFRQDFISRKTIKNTGQLPMYLIENHHEGIVDRDKFNKVQTEMARRSAARSPSQKTPTGLTSYASKYALSERLVCGECGTLYRRCTWTQKGVKRIVWRCVSRLDYGKKYCHSSPTLDEAPLQQAILSAIATMMASKESLIQQITGSLKAEVIPFPGSGLSLGDIDRRLAELEAQFQKLLKQATNDPAAYSGQFKEILDEQTFLKEKRTAILAESKHNAEINQRIMDAAVLLDRDALNITEWDESVIRQMVETVKVLSKNEIIVTLKGGAEINQRME